MYEALISHLRECAKLDPAENTFREAADAIEKLQGLYYLMKKTAKWLSEKIPKWIPVTERLPDMHVDVLVCTEDYGKTELGFSTCAVWDGTEWLETWERKTYLTAVTHWMPLPEPPKEES